MAVLRKARDESAGARRGRGRWRHLARRLMLLLCIGVLSLSVVIGRTRLCAIVSPPATPFWRQLHLPSVGHEPLGRQGDCPQHAS